MNICWDLSFPAGYRLSYNELVAVGRFDAVQYRHGPLAVLIPLDDPGIVRPDLAGKRKQAG
jgi:hypothetical protein